jgi:hypothetical protein
MSPSSTTIISDNVRFITEVADVFYLWIEDPKKRDDAMKMLNDFDTMTDKRYWLTEDEELFIDQLDHLLETQS